MTWFGWLLITWWGLTALMTVSQIGKPRKPLEPRTGICADLALVLEVTRP